MKWVLTIWYIHGYDLKASYQHHIGDEYQHPFWISALAHGLLEWAFNPTRDAAVRFTIRRNRKEPTK